MNLRTRTASSAVMLLLAGGLAFAQAPADPAVAPDNSKMNKQDRAMSAPTADQAKNNLPDRQLMQNIRKAVVDDKTLSTYAHNVKIIAEHGKITLKGPVRSEEESKNIEAKATDVAGAGNVTNQLTVKPDKDTASR